MQTVLWQMFVVAVWLDQSILINIIVKDNDVGVKEAKSF